MGMISWIIVGAIAGWIASIITGNEESVGTGANTVVGMIGGLIGGCVMNVIFGTSITGFNLWSLPVSVIGAVILLWTVNAYKHSV